MTTYDWEWIDPPLDYDHEDDAEFLAALDNDELWATVPQPVLNG